MILMPSSTLEWVAALLVGVLGAARMTRLITWDDYPPMVKIRDWWKDHSGEWEKLATCPFCAAPYIVAGSMAWAYFSDLHWTWWAFNLWLAASYLAAMIVARDEPE